MGMFEERREPPKGDVSGPVEAEDAILESISRLRELTGDARIARDAFSAPLSEACASARKLAEELRSAHFTVNDTQQKLLRDVEKGVTEAQQFQERNAPRDAAKIDRVAVLRDAATRTGIEAVFSFLGDEKNGSLAQRAAAAGQALEAAVARARTRWMSGAGRATTLDDRVVEERLRATLRSKPLAEVFAFVVATLSTPDLDETEWAQCDQVAREIAIDALTKRPAADSRKNRHDTGAGASNMLAQRILDRLDQAVVERMPASIVAATDAVGEYKRVFALLVAPSASTMTSAEFRSFRTTGEAGLASMLQPWSVDPNYLGRFLEPRPFRMIGWRPVSHVDLMTGNVVRASR